MSDVGIVEAADPETVFKALSDATRVDILLSLWDATDRTATFSELRDAVGVRDSGQFNYHLDKLRDRFVHKTDDGYTLTLAGKQIVGAIRTGAYTMTGSIEPIPLDDPCPTCGGDRIFRYEDETVRIECVDCPVVATTGIPPGVFAGYDREQFPAVANRYFVTIFQHVSNGFCWYCDGRSTPSVDRIADVLDDADIIDEFADRPTVEYTCERCGAGVRCDPGVAFQSHPAVIGFFYEHGIDVRDHPFWEVSALGDAPATFLDEDPVRARLAYALDDQTLTVRFDDDLTVLDTERSDT